MNHRDMAEDTSVVLSAVTFRPVCICPDEDPFSERQKPMSDDVPWATILGCAVTYFYLVHSDNNHRFQDRVTSAARDKILANRRCSRQGMPHPRAAGQRCSHVRGTPRRMS
jgi:hypothetical protein